MNFSLVFEKSGDTLPFSVRYNHDLLEFFVNYINSISQNLFSDEMEVYRTVNKRITHLHWAISKTNEVFYDLVDDSFEQHTDLENYLDQRYLNKLHSDWVFSHHCEINIDTLRFSSDFGKSKLGNQLHELYPDDIRVIKTAQSLEKLGYIYPYREINMGIHRLESAFSNFEFKASDKWEVVKNPFIDNMVTNNDVVNFYFGYTYVGRQYYNKFRFFDSKLEYPDHYNYENLELAFQINLSRQETIPFSKESISWAEENGVKLIAEQVPIGNLIGLEDNLLEYRKILYRNSFNNDRVHIVLN